MSKRRKQLQQYNITTLLREKNILLLYQHSNIKAHDWALLKGELLELSPANPTRASQGIQEGDDDRPLGPASLSDARVGISMLVIKNRIGELALFNINWVMRLLADLPLPLFVTAPVQRKRCTKSAHDQSHASQSDACFLQRGTPILGRSPGKLLEAPPLIDGAPHQLEGLPRRPDKEPHGSTPLLQGSIFLVGCDSHKEMVSACDAISRCRNDHKSGMTVLVGGLYYGRVVTHLDVARLSTLTPLARNLMPTTLESRLLSFVTEELSQCQKELLHCLDAYKGLLTRN
jgi:hypothetical protein